MSEDGTQHTGHAPERVCFQLQVDSARLDEYRERHAAVWPDVLRAIEASGRRNSSLFLRQDGLLIGYYEVDADAVLDLPLTATSTVTIDGATPDDARAHALVGPGQHRIVVAAARVADPAALVAA